MTDPLKEEASLGQYGYTPATAPEASLNAPPVYYCKNPECSRQITRRTARNRIPQHCNRECEARRRELERGQCQRPGCTNWIPAGKSGHKYCSDECFKRVVFVPRTPCQRPGCTNMVTTAHAVYCSPACRDQMIDMKELSRRGMAVIKAYMDTTGRPPRYKKRAAATSANNKKAPPRLKVPRSGRIYGYDAVFEPARLDTGEMGYRGSIPEIAGMIARGKTKKAADLELRRLLREAGIKQKRLKSS